MISDISSDKPSEAETADLDSRIQERAYLLWEAEGRQEGGPDDYWHRARELMEAESQSSYPPTQSRGHRS